MKAAKTYLIGLIDLLVVHDQTPTWDGTTLLWPPLIWNRTLFVQLIRRLGTVAGHVVRVANRPRFGCYTYLLRAKVQGCKKLSKNGVKGCPKRQL